MAMLLTRFGWLLVLALATGPSPALAQSDGDASLPDAFDEPIPLYPAALGEFTRPISSSNAEAQAYFDQGFQMMYAFAKEDAAGRFARRGAGTRTAPSATGVRPGRGVRI